MMRLIFIAGQTSKGLLQSTPLDNSPNRFFDAKHSPSQRVGHEVRGVGAAWSVAWDFGGFLHPFLPTKKDGRLSLRNPACGTG
ncbi:MAG: hypothetical protein AAF399_29045, partial [Bacteroidota bacterium]